jgi:hypothetical protein
MRSGCRRFLAFDGAGPAVFDTNAAAVRMPAAGSSTDSTILTSVRHRSGVTSTAM